MQDFTNPDFMAQRNANPFSDDVFVDHPDHLPGVVRIHHRPFQRIAQAVEAMVASPREEATSQLIGRTILLTAPRAGYGKTHLAARLREHLRTAAVTVTLPLDPSRPVTWPVALSSILRQFCRHPAIRHGSDSLFEETGRYFLSRLVLSHLDGDGDENDCPEGTARIRTDFAELFAGESESGLLHWTEKRSHHLSREADPDLLHSLGLSPSELGFWTRLLIDWNLRGDPAMESLKGLSNGEARERLLQWLRIAAFHRPVLVVADGLDGFFGSETAGMEIAGILTGIREAVPRSLTLLSLNEDVWRSIFRDRLPSAWLDRLSGETETLHTLAPETARDLVLDRLARTDLSEAAAERFADRLAADHLWVDEGSGLYPRAVLRQARDLWQREGVAFRRADAEAPESEPEAEEEPLSDLTDKPEFFAALQEDSAAIARSRQEPHAPSPPRREEEATEDADPSPAPASGEAPGDREPAPENPFFAGPPRPAPDKLAGIDSIIDDIRGSGKTVASESPPVETASAEEETEESQPMGMPSSQAGASQAGASEAGAFQAGDLTVQPARNGTEKPTIFPGFAPPVNEPSGASASPAASCPATPEELESRLRELEAELLSGPALRLDLERLARFVRTVGARHGGFIQTEERYPSSRTVCLRWQVRGRSVLVGFESPRNVYFWNNLLQQSLASNRQEKITAFSHASEPFDPALFSGFGFSPAVIKGRIDIVEMNDRELAMLYAAEGILTEARDGPLHDAAIQLVTRHLDPLWRRISQPV